MKKLLLLLSLLSFNASAVDPTIEPTTPFGCVWPSEREDGRVFTEAERGGVNLYRSNIPDVYDPDKLVATSNTLCTFTIDNTVLTSGNYYYVVTAFDTQGRESDYSAEYMHTIMWPPLPPKPPTGLGPVPQN